jgi:chaperonin cofactor prefoldin
MVSSAVSNLQQALNCAGKCDCCANLQSQINALKAEIARIPRVNEAKIINEAKLQAKDLIMPLVFSYVISQIKPIQELIRGFENVLFRLSGQVANLISRLSALEAMVINALKTAANALGISNQALRQIGALAARVAPLFSLIGTVLNLIAAIATLKTLGARIDALERQVDSVANSVSQILGKLLGLQNHIQAVDSKASTAIDLGHTAVSLANAADSAAGAARRVGENALSVASLGLVKASQAQSTADGAVRNAATANANATTAFQKAAEAQSTANTAQSTATEAKGIGQRAGDLAGKAFSKAGEALGVALTAIALYQGLKGLQGLRGLQGTPGRDGAPGRPGRDGLTTTLVVPMAGVPGPRGERGLPGISGLPGRPGRDGLPGRDGIDAMPYNDAGLRAFIAAQHAATRINSTSQHNVTRFSILTPIMAALAPIGVFVKQIFDIVSKFSDAAQLVLLNIINNKLGDQLLGGIGGKLSRIGDWLHLDRVLNILIAATTIHNALMLSNDIGQTLLGAINNVLTLIGLKKEDGSAFDLGSVISGSIENLIKGAIGTENYTNLTTAWAKANRIYQATTNIFNSFQGLAYSILNANEMLGSMTGKIGNALRKSGAVLEKSYEWFNPQPKYNRVTQGLEALQQGASTIQQVTQIPLDITAQVTELTTASTEFVKAIKEDDKPTNKGIGSPEPDKIKADELAAKTVSATGFDLLESFFEEDE